MAQLRLKDQIPLYSADGELRDWISPQRVARLESAGLVRVVRHKRGHVNRCIMQWRPGDPRPTTLSVYLGRPYSFLEPLESGRRVWTLRELRKGEGAPTAVLESITGSNTNRERASVSFRQIERAQLAQVAPAQ